MQQNRWKIDDNVQSILISRNSSICNCRCTYLGSLGNQIHSILLFTLQMLFLQKMELAIISCHQQKQQHWQPSPYLPGGAATHRSSNSSKRQLIECPLEVPFIKKYLWSTIHRMGGNSSNTLIVVPFIESTIKCSRIHEESETLNRFLLAALEAEI